MIIHWDNIKQYKDGNFRKLNKNEATTLGLPYDVHSVMHYDEEAFAKREGLKTITVKGGQSVYNDELSPIDVIQARKLYNCPGEFSCTGIVINPPDLGLIVCSRFKWYIFTLLDVT